MKAEAKKLLNRCYETAISIYGAPLPKFVSDRLNLEMNAIAKNGWAEAYLIATGMADQAHDMGHSVTARGMTGSSLVSFLCGISGVNPLPPHYICPKCHHFEMPEAGEDDRTHGYDLPDKACPDCGIVMKQDGGDIRPEILMGIQMNREPEFMLNFAPSIRKDIVQGIRDRYSENLILRAGVYCKDEAGETRVGVHPCGVYIVPQGMDISAVTELRECDPDDEFGLPVAVRDFAELHGILNKYDILPLPELELLHELEEETGYKQTEIRLNDRQIINNICQEGLAFLPGQNDGNTAIKRAIDLAQPKCFSDIVRLLGMLQGVGAWQGNGEDLLRKGFNLRDLICSRDDVFQHLLSKGLDNATAWDIMKDVRGWRGVSEAKEQVLRKIGVPEWYIESCRKIKYLYPKSQNIEYTIMYFKLAHYRMCYPELFKKLTDV